MQHLRQPWVLVKSKAICAVKRDINHLETADPQPPTYASFVICEVGAKGREVYSQSAFLFVACESDHQSESLETTSNKEELMTKPQETSKTRYLNTGTRERNPV